MLAHIYLRQSLLGNLQEDIFPLFFEQLLFKDFFVIAF